MYELFSSYPTTQPYNCYAFVYHKESCKKRPETPSDKKVFVFTQKINNMYKIFIHINKYNFFLPGNYENTFLLRLP